jgi:hypothetical protein
MEREKNEERRFFENLIESFSGLARPAAKQYVKDLNMERIPDREKAAFVERHINLVMGDILSIDRMEYRPNDIDKLWELFNSRGYLNNAEEIQKLQDMVIQCEIYKSLTMLKLEINNSLKVARKNRKIGSPLLNGGICANELCEVLRNLDEDFHVTAVPSNTDDLNRAALCHDWSAEKDPIYAGCMTTDLKVVVDCVKRYNPDFNYANIGRCKLFISKKGIFVSQHDLASSRSKNYKRTRRIESYFVPLRKKR